MHVVMYTTSVFLSRKSAISDPWPNSTYWN